MLQQSRRHPWEPRYRQGDDQQQKTREEPKKGLRRGEDHQDQGVSEGEGGQVSRVQEKSS